MKLERPLPNTQQRREGGTINQEGKARQRPGSRGGRKNTAQDQEGPTHGGALEGHGPGVFSVLTLKAVLHVPRGRVVWRESVWGNTCCI